jgi:uncharacterized protein HemX
MTDKHLTVEVDADDVRTRLRRAEGELAKLRDDLRMVEGELVRFRDESIRHRVRAEAAEEAKKWWETRAAEERTRAEQEYRRAEEVRRDPRGKGLAWVAGLFIGLMLALGGFGVYGVLQPQEERRLRQEAEKRGAEAREDADRQRKFRMQAEDAAREAERKREEAEQKLRDAEQRLKKAGS